MSFLLSLTMMFAAAILHRLRGGLLQDSRIDLPGNDGLWTALMLGMCAGLVTGSFTTGIAYWASMLMWSLIPHGRWWMCSVAYTGPDDDDSFTGFFEELMEWSVSWAPCVQVRNGLLFGGKHFVALLPLIIVSPRHWLMAFYALVAAALIVWLYDRMLLSRQANNVELWAGAIMWGPSIMLMPGFPLISG
jgi:hypothetical protein